MLAGLSTIAMVPQHTSLLAVIMPIMIWFLMIGHTRLVLYLQYKVRTYVLKTLKVTLLIEISDVLETTRQWRHIPTLRQEHTAFGYTV